MAAYPPGPPEYPMTTQPGGYPPPQPQGFYPPPGQSAPGYPPPGQAYDPNMMYPPVTTQQPQQGMRPDNCPQGLEYLTQIDQVLVKQKIELLEVLLDCESRNKYLIKNSMGQEIYKAKEITDCLTRNCCGPIRPFDMSIFDHQEREVIHLNRPLNCQECCFPCCLQTMEVSAPNFGILGTIEQQWSILQPDFIVYDSDGEMALRISGPFCTCSIKCGDVEFKILSPDGNTEVGKISKQWTGLLSEAFTDSDNFGITFPMDLDVRMKATLLGALFLIDFMYFEQSNN